MSNVWNGSNPWSVPSNNPLASGLSYAAQPPTAAVADPAATPTTTNPTSAARMLGTAMAEPSSGTLAQTAQQPAQPQSFNLGQGLSRLSVSQGTPLSVAPNATSNTQGQAQNTAAAPPQVVAVPSGSGGGDYTYFTYSTAAGGYVPAGYYNSQTKQGYTDAKAAAQLQMQIAQAQQTMQQFGSGEMGMANPIYQRAQQTVADATRQLQGLKWDPASLGSQVTYSGTPLQTNSPDSGVSQVNQQYSQQIDTYKAGAQTAQANNAAAAQSQLTAQAVAYMTSHGGAMDPNIVLPASVQQAAQDAYAKQNANNGSLFQINGSTGMAPINTDTADIAGIAAQNAITSQYNTNLGGADAGAIGRNAAFAHVAQTGANQVTHDQAAAQSFNNNLQNFGNALQAQATTDTNATGTKLNNDIQNVSDVAAALEQQIGNLDATTQAAVKGQLDNLNNMINYYNQQVQQYGSDVGFVMNIAKGILAAGAGIAAVATGGVAGVAIAAAAAGTAAATK